LLVAPQLKFLIKITGGKITEPSKSSQPIIGLNLFNVKKKAAFFLHWLRVIKFWTCWKTVLSQFVQIAKKLIGIIKNINE